MSSTAGQAFHACVDYDNCFRIKLKINFALFFFLENIDGKQHQKD